ncbi:MAG: hypothetical protein GY729_00160 [Desulfobacteraceae bacterium]|nr:hypothetical protein [Desulfobacteraceae bacterium]
MNEKQQEAFDPKSFLSAWMKSAEAFNTMIKDFSPGSAKAQPGQVPPFQAFKWSSKKTASSMNSAQKIWSSIFASLNDPEIFNAMTTGLSAMPEVGMKMAESGWETYYKLQKQFSDKLSNLGKTTQPYSFENLDENMFKVWAKMYDKEFSKIYKMPKLGLARQYQERFSAMMDKYNIFQNAAAEFSRILNLPLEKSMQVMQEKLDEIAKSGNIPDNSQEFYKLWIKILEGHYMTLFKSPDYLEAMSNALKSMTDFNLARHEMLQDLIQILPIPSNKDMDELYKDHYVLQKKIKQMGKRLKALENGK